MTEAASLVPIRHHELEIGKPLRKPGYDANGKLLLASGYVVESQNQLDGLLENGFFPAGEWESQKPVADATAPSGQRAAGGGNAAATAAAGKEILVQMTDVRWSVGETVYLQVVDNAALRYAVRLIGFVKNKTVFVTSPVIDGKFEFIRDGQTFIVRAFSGKKAFAFMASAVKSVHTPHPYLHLTYPKQVRCNVVRQGARAEVKIIAALTVGENAGAGMLTDLSIGGASVSAKEPLGVKGDTGRVKFKVQAVGEDEFMNIEAILRWVGPPETGEGFKHGFEFVNLTTQEKLILSAVVHQTLVENS